MLQGNPGTSTLCSGVDWCTAGSSSVGNVRPVGWSNTQGLQRVLRCPMHRWSHGSPRDQPLSRHPACEHQIAHEVRQEVSWRIWFANRYILQVDSFESFRSVGG
jgi:hypothetical protein